MKTPEKRQDDKQGKTVDNVDNVDETAPFLPCSLGNKVK